MQKHKLVGSQPASGVQDEVLAGVLREQGAFESAEGNTRRQMVIQLLNTMARQWAGSSTGAVVLPFGSYRLGVHAPASDVDLLCVGAAHTSSDAFFATFGL